MQKIIPFLWFDNQAEEAAKFYTSLFKNSKIGKIARYGEEAAKASGRAKGSVMTISFQLEGQDFVGLNGGPHFKFTPAISFFVWCETEKEIDEKWAGLSKGGLVRMELNKYPFAEKYGWCEDKFGVGWQLILSSSEQKIAPAFLFVQDKFGKGEEAINFYMSLFKNSKIEVIARDEAAKSVMHATFLLGGQKFVLMESGMKEHKYTFSPAISFIVNCKTQEEVDEYWNKLSKGGSTEQCGWLKDKYGVSWQIVPTVLGEMLQDKDANKSREVMKALLQMNKIEIKALKRAYNTTKK